jgi:hypothetical protein
MSKDINTIQEKLQARMNEFREALQDDDKRRDLHESIPGSEVLIRFEVFLPSPDPKELVDGLFLYMNDSAEIVTVEYYYRNMSEGEVTEVSGADLEVVKELFADSFTLEVE